MIFYRKVEDASNEKAVKENVERAKAAIEKAAKEKATKAKALKEKIEKPKAENSTSISGCSIRDMTIKGFKEALKTLDIPDLSSDEAEPEEEADQNMGGLFGDDDEF